MLPEMRLVMSLAWQHAMQQDEKHDGRTNRVDILNAQPNDQWAEQLRRYWKSLCLASQDNSSDRGC